MGDLLEEERKVARSSKLRTVSNFAFIAADIVVGFLASSVAVAVAGGFIGLGDFTAGKLFNRERSDSDRSVALLRDIHKHFGWT